MICAKSLYDRIFGSGPAIAVASALCIAAGWIMARSTPSLAWSLPAHVALAGLSLSTVIAVAIIAWSVHTLRPERRGAELVTGGPFRFVRHPLYAAGLSVIGPALALSHPVYIGAVILAHVCANRLIRREESLMGKWFPDSYPAFCRRTARFFPVPVARASPRNA